jgi:hypothetical protein
LSKRRIIAIAAAAALVLATSAGTCAATPTPTVATPTTYYVNAQTGADTNSGTSASAPWKSIAMANAAVQPGDTVILSGDFVREAIAPIQSGTATAPITYQADTTAGATLDQPGLVSGTSYMAWFGGRSYVTVNGIGFTNSNYVNAPVTWKGVVLRGSSHITITNCSFSHVQMIVYASSFNTISHNTFRYFVASYYNPATRAPDPNHPITAGDMLNVFGGSNSNLIQFNDMKYAGHALIEIGNGLGGTNANNEISDNTLSNPWYRPLALSDDGAGTIVERNLIEDANSVPTLYSTVPGMVGKRSTASNGVQFTGSNFIFRNNTLVNNTSVYGVVDLGAWWYTDANHPNGVLVGSNNNQIYGNTIRNCRGAATFSFVEFLSKQDIRAGRRAVPRITGNLIHDNTIVGASGTPHSWNGSRFYSTVMYHSASAAPRWGGLHGNKVYNNHGFNLTHVYLIDGVFRGGATVHKVESLAQFEASNRGSAYQNG